MTEFPIVPAINCDLSSIKFSVLDITSCDCLLSGVAEGINAEWAFPLLNSGEPVVLAQCDCEGALQAIVGALVQHNLIDSVALIGHRVAHGGDLFTESVITSGEVTNNIRQVSSLVPLHNYASFSGIASTQRLFPQVIQVAVFDTSFHQTLAPEAFLYGLSWEYYQSLGVRRYDFRGTLHHYVSQRALALLGLPEQGGGLVIAHLGNGALIRAARDGRSVGTSMGVTPLGGLVMGTRGDDVDFGAMAQVAGKIQQVLSDLERVANTASGLLGISDPSSDLRVLEQTQHEGHTRARLVTRTFIRRITRHTVGHATTLQHLDDIIFAGGISENPILIHRLTSKWLVAPGLEMNIARNQQLNSADERLISADGSRVRCVVTPTNEECMIALDTIHLGRIRAVAALA